MYGDTKNYPIKEDYNTDKPLSFYAASKKCNEVIAHSPALNLPTTGLRFFTVYGPMGRPDMALFKFVYSAINGKKLNCLIMATTKEILLLLMMLLNQLEN